MGQTRQWTKHPGEKKKVVMMMKKEAFLEQARSSQRRGISESQSAKKTDLYRGGARSPDKAVFHKLALAR